MSYAAGAAGGLSLFNMWATSKAIEKNNQAAVDNYNLVNASLISAQIANWNNGVYAAQEMKRVSNISIMEAKPSIEQQASKVAMSEGITAGNSKARMLQDFYLEAAQKIGQQNQATESAVNKLAMGIEQENWNLQQQRVQAYNTMHQNLITGNNAALQIIGSGISGAAKGYSAGNMLDAANFGDTLKDFFSGFSTKTASKTTAQTGAVLSTPSGNISDNYNGYPSGFKSYNPYEF